MTLTKLKCSGCGEYIYPKNGTIKTTISYNDCLRRCEKCEIGFSNSKNNPTVIFKNYKENVPEMLREDLDFSLNDSINEMNRKNKKNKFGFSTSEDALTWSFFNISLLRINIENCLKYWTLKAIFQHMTLIYGGQTFAKAGGASMKVFEKPDFDFNGANVFYPLSHEKIALMYRRAIDNGFASFAEA